MEVMKTRFYLLLSSLILCTACGPHQVKGEPPFTNISSMSLKESSLSVKIDIHNVNDIELDIDAVDIKILVHDVELINYIGAFALVVDPNSTEEMALDELANESARHMLTELENGEVSSLAFSLQGRVHTKTDGYLKFEREGHLYPIPGKPGQFRFASSRTRERR